jgi:glycosyltransferase involved in cell wall biosynthesis
MTLPTVSVVIPVRDGERYLPEALASALHQVPPPAEVIVVDDGSRDGSRSVADSFGAAVRVIAQEPAGAGAARNRGVAAATGEVIGFLDADDCWCPDALAARLAPFERRPAPDMVWGWVHQFHSPDLDPVAASRLRVPEEAQPGHLVGGMLVTREAFDRVGPFRSDLAVGEFVDWMARAREQGLREVMVDAVVLWRRLHASNLGLRHQADRRDMARVVKSALDRRRAASGEAQ